MNTTNTSEISLQAEVEALKTRFSNTQELYREVCALLFFRYGTTPTANKLYQLVRKGSMSAPSQALVSFWEELREKSRTRIEHPDLPETLTSAAGELVATLWRHAQEAAAESLSAFKAEAQAMVDAARMDVAAFELERDRALQREQGTQQALTAAEQEIISYREALAADNAAKQAVNTALEQMQHENQALQQQLQDTRASFSAELEKLHQAAQLSEIRSREMEKRLMVDIDKERLATAKAQRETDAVRAAAKTTEAQLLTERKQLEQQLQTTQHENSKLEGALHSLQLTQERTEHEIKSLHQQINQLSTALALHKERKNNYPSRTSRASKRKNLKVLEGKVRSNIEN